MGDVILVRPDDHLVVGVRWSGFTVSGFDSSARLVAGPGAWLILVLPPQHIAEETSPRDSEAPFQQPVAAGGGSVPVWRAVLSGLTRVKFNVTAGSQIPLTAEGLLSAAAGNAVIVTETDPGDNDTAIELPYRLLIAPAPRGRTPGATVVCRHPIQASADANGLWRTQLVDSSGKPADTLLNAHLELTIASKTVADSADPTFPLPPRPPNTITLPAADRREIHRETATNRNPARLNRLELSTLGGTLDAIGVFPSFEWEHRTVLGRDMHVRKAFKGAMYPLGHRAIYQELTERVYDEHLTAGGAAVLRVLRVLTILDPVRRAPNDGAVRRAFPLGEIEITQTVFANLLAPDTDPQNGWKQFTFPGIGSERTFFTPSFVDPQDPQRSSPVRFPVTGATSAGEVKLDIPLFFVRDVPGAASLTNPDLADRLAQAYGSVEASITPTDIDLVGAPPTLGSEVPADVHEVHALTLAGYNRTLGLADGYRAKLSALQIALPALRTLQDADPRRTVKFVQKYIDNGPTEDVLLELTEKLPINFADKADRSGGLLAPIYETNAISRRFGPIDTKSLPNPLTGNIDPLRLFPSDKATLLGFPLRLLLTELKMPPQITAKPVPVAGAAPQIEMRWQKVKLKTSGVFLAGPNSALDLTIKMAPQIRGAGLDSPAVSGGTVCTIKSFALQVPPGNAAVLKLSFSNLTFSQESGKSPTLKVGDVVPKFLGNLSLIAELAEALELGDAGKLLDVTPRGIVMRYSVPAPPVTSGVFVMRNITFNAAVTVPFNGDPLSIMLGFASRANPFQLAVMLFGGTGYVELDLNHKGIRRFEAALEFGAFVALDFVIATGEVYVLGGVRFELVEGEVTITGYLRIGGSVEVLGLISVSVELCLALAYRSADNVLAGRATLVIEIDLTLWSDSVELDSGEWVLAGGDPREASPRLATGIELWRDYFKAFADVDSWISEAATI